MREEDYWQNNVAAGTLLNSVSCDSSSSRYIKRTYKRSALPGWIYVFDPAFADDVLIYKGPFALTKSEEQMPIVYEHFFETSKDLKLPSKEDRLQAFRNTIKKDPIKMVKELKDVQDCLKKRTSFVTDAAIECELSTENVFDIIYFAYELFCYSMQSPQNYTITKCFANIISAEFDGMVDDNDAGRYNGSSSPLIIFDSKSSLIIREGSKVIPVEVIDSNVKTLRERRESIGLQLIR